MVVHTKKNWTPVFICKTFWKSKLFEILPDHHTVDTGVLKRSLTHVYSNFSKDVTRTLHKCTLDEKRMLVEAAANSLFLKTLP